MHIPKSSVNLSNLPINTMHEEIDNLDLRYSYTITDKHGNKKREVIDQPCHSFVKQFIQFIRLMFGCIVSDTLKDTGNSNRTVATATAVYTPRVDAANAIATYGLQVGTGTTAVTVSEYTIETQIAHGSGAGQLSYGAVSFVAPATDATTSYFSVNRTFTNDSGGTITVAEISLVAMYNNWMFLFIRDVLSVAIEVKNTDILTIKYTLVATA